MAEHDLALRGGAPIGLDFAALKAEGIAALQDLCGASWTDYNLHDPGVTVLEQLVYGLTDLAYRTEFEVADYLTGPDGAIAYEDLALYAPADVFHGQALTVADYRRSLYDAIPSISEIRVRALGNGRLAIDVAVAAEIQTPQGRASIAQRVRKHYAKHRNLCEDLHQVTVLEPVAWYLDGDIDLCGARAPADILAQILFDCRNVISSGMTVHRQRDLIAQGMPLETVYAGPPTANGYVTVGENPAQERTVTISELVGVIGRIEGVRRVRRLAFRGADGAQTEEIGCDTRTGRYPCLPFPKDGARAWLRLHAEHGARFGMPSVPRDEASAGMNSQALHDDAGHALKKLQFHGQAFRTAAMDGAVPPLPVGRYRELAGYYSVQNDFPAVYGIGQYGLPQSAGAARIAQAQQLKGFLFPFEQLMANYLRNLQQIPTLFSARDEGHASYFGQRLSNRHIPDIEALLIDPEGGQFHALEEQDDYCERKGRVLDYLLALHGDAFPQDALRRFNQYHANDTERWLLGAKAQLVRNLPVLSARRGTAANYLAEPGSEDSVSVLERRVAILLGLGDPAAADEAAERLRVVEHVLLWPSDRVPLDKYFYGSRMSVVLPDWTARCADGDFRQFVQETVLRNCPAHVYPGFLWLSRERMAAFEALWDDWRGALRALHRERATLALQAASDRAAAALAAFLARPEDER